MSLYCVGDRSVPRHGGVKSIAQPMWHVYILQSMKDKRYYVGCTKQLPHERLAGHNNGDTVSTKKRAPFKLVYYEKIESRSDAFAREKQIKGYKGGNAFRKLVQ